MTRIPDIIIKSSDNFTMVSNQSVKDNNLSLKAKGLLLLLMSNKKGKWTTYIESIIKNSKDGDSSVRSGIKELEENNYLLRFKHKKGTVWICCDDNNKNLKDEARKLIKEK